MASFSCRLAILSIMSLMEACCATWTRAGWEAAATRLWDCSLSSSKPLQAMHSPVCWHWQSCVFNRSSSRCRPLRSMLSFTAISYAVDDTAECIHARPRLFTPLSPAGPVSWTHAGDFAGGTGPPPRVRQLRSSQAGTGQDDGGGTGPAGLDLLRPRQDQHPSGFLPLLGPGAW